MTRDEIDRLWFGAYVHGMLPFEQRERFAALVAAAEREECAKVAEALLRPYETHGVPDAIRARGARNGPDA